LNTVKLVLRGHIGRNKKWAFKDRFKRGSIYTIFSMTGQEKGDL